MAFVRFTLLDRKSGALSRIPNQRQAPHCRSPHQALVLGAAKQFLRWRKERWKPALAAAFRLDCMGRRRVLSIRPKYPIPPLVFVPHRSFGGSFTMANSANLKVDRAAKHVAELDDLFREQRPFSYILETDLKTGERATFAKKDEAVVE